MNRATSIFTPNLRNLLLSSLKLNTNHNPLISPLTTPYLGHNFFSSDSGSSKEPNVADPQKPESATDDFDVVSKEELRKQIQRFYEGDEDAVPDIFESILKRKLVGHKDDDLMTELRQKDEVDRIEDEVDRIEDEELSSDFSDTDDEVQ